MQSTRARVAVLVGAVAVVVVLFVVLNGGGDNSSTTSSTAATNQSGKLSASAPTITYKNGEVQGGVQTLSYTHGDQIQFRVESDVPVDAHLHGYNVELPVTPGKPTDFNVAADLEGVFDLELHLPDGELQVAVIKVNPA
jgi:hypothetical protein